MRPVSSAASTFAVAAQILSNHTDEDCCRREGTLYCNSHYIDDQSIHTNNAGPALSLFLCLFFVSSHCFVECNLKQSRTPLALSSLSVTDRPVQRQAKRVVCTAPYGAIRMARRFKRLSLLCQISSKNAFLSRHRHQGMSLPHAPLERLCQRPQDWPRWEWTSTCVGPYHVATHACC